MSTRVTVSKSIVRVTQADGTQVRVSNTAVSNVRVSTVGLQGPPGTRIVEMALSLSGSIPTNSLLRRYVATADITFSPTDAFALAASTVAADMIFPIKDESGASLGNITFLSGSTVGSVTMSQTAFVRGDVIDFFAPPTADPAINIIAISIPANR